MRDLLGNTLDRGDIVALPDGRGSKGSMSVGRIVSSGVVMAVIEPVQGDPRSVSRTVKRYFEDLVRIAP